MLSNKKNTIVIILIIIAIIIIFTIILIIKLINKTDENIYQTNSNILSSEEKRDMISELKNELDNKTNEKILSVNNEKISEREIILINFQINNKYVNNNENSKDVIDETIRQYVILQNAQQQNITLTEEEISNIEERVKSFIIKENEETNSILDAFGMNYNDFLKFYTERTKKLEIISKWEINTINAINNGKINIPNETFKKEYQEYKKSTDNKKRTDILLELLKIYEEYLKKEAIVEYY